MVFAEVCPFVGTFQQAVARLHRTGQKAESVNIYILVAQDTIAVTLRNTLIKKDEYQESVMKDKRAILSDLMGADGIQGEL
jgi:SNF2 family DNA or RNA helicase